MFFQLTLFAIVCVCLPTGDGQTISPSVLEGQVGDTVSFVCVARRINVDNAVEIWVPGQNGQAGTFVNFETMADGIARLTRVDDQTNITLTMYTLTPLRSTDNGVVFRCGANANTATISVTFAPIIAPRQGGEVNPVQLREGTSYTITFDVSANPPPTFSWTRNNMVVMNGSGLTANLNSLVLNPAMRQHAGMYRLVVTNSVGMDDYNFTVDVQFPPEFPTEYITPNNLNNMIMNDIFVVAVNDRQDVTLLCNAVGNPQPNITFSFPTGGANPPTTSGNNIVITGAMASNAGNYSCTADTNVRRFQLFVGGQPQPLSGVIDVTIMDGTVTFRWNYDNSANGVPATKFVINVTRSGGPDVRQMLDVNERQYSIPPNTLASNQSYTVSVAARSLQGDSDILSNTFRSPVMDSGGISTIVCASWSVLTLLLATVTIFG